MVSLFEALSDNVQQGLCNSLSLAENTARLGSNFYGSIGLRGASQTSQQAAQMWSNAAGIACNREPQDLSGLTGPPFPGGQCPGTLYAVTTRQRTVVNGNENITQPGTANGVGPLSFTSTPPDGSAPNTAYEAVLDAGGNPVRFAAVSSGDPNAQLEAELLVDSVVPLNGGPNNCGDPPGNAPGYEPGPFTTNPTVNYEDENGDPQTTSPTIVYRPLRTGPGGDFVVPVSVEFEDGSSVFGDFNLTTGDLNFGGGNSGGDGVSGPEREKDPDEPLAEGEKIVGVRVISSPSSDGAAKITRIFGVGDSPDLLVPRTGSVLFKYESSVGNGWSQPFDVKTSDAVIYSEEEAIDAVFIPQVSVTFTLKWIVRSFSAEE